MEASYVKRRWVLLSMPTTNVVTAVQIKVDIRSATRVAIFCLNYRSEAAELTRDVAKIDLQGRSKHQARQARKHLHQERSTGEQVRKDRSPR